MLVHEPSRAAEDFAAGRIDAAEFAHRAREEAKQLLDESGDGQEAKLSPQEADVRRTSQAGSGD